MKTKKLILFICIMMFAVTILAACGNNVTDDAELREQGYNIVAYLDCGKYQKSDFDVNKAQNPMLYGEATADELKDNYAYGIINKYEKQIRRFYVAENSYLPDNIFAGGVNEPQLVEKEFVNWRVASVVLFQQVTNDDGTVSYLLNAQGQLVYDRVIPQEGDVVWSKDSRVGTYDDHPYAVVQTLHDNSKDIDAMVEVNGEMVPNLYTPDSELMSYNAEDGFNVFLYATYSTRPYFVLEWTNEEGNQEFVSSIRARESSSKISELAIRKIEKTGYTFYGLYADQELSTAWDFDTTFGSFEVDPEKPYVIVYVRFLEGEWDICKTASEVASAVSTDSSVWLDNDVTFTGSTVWRYRAIYTKEFNGNGHTITFENSVVIDGLDVNNFGLFGSFSGKIYDVTFVNVQLETEVPGRITAWSRGVCVGVLVGRIVDGAEFTNVTVSGKVVYRQNWNEHQQQIPDSDPAEYYPIYAEGGWYGRDFTESTTTFGVTFTPTV